MAYLKGVKMNHVMFSHGDVLFQKIDCLPINLIMIKGNIVQEGELTGHAHRINTGEFKLFHDKDGVKFLEVTKESKISHEEHHTGTIDPGFYRIGITKEYDYESEELRNVAD